MTKTKKNPPEKGRLGKKGQLLVDSAKIIANSNDPVKLIAELIQYRRLADKIYREHMKIK